MREKDGILVPTVLLHVLKTFYLDKGHLSSEKELLLLFILLCYREKKKILLTAHWRSS